MMTTPKDHLKGLEPVTIWPAHRAAVLAEVEWQGLAFTADADTLALLHYRDGVSPEESAKVIALVLKRAAMKAWPAC